MGVAVRRRARFWRNRNAELEKAKLAANMHPLLRRHVEFRAPICKHGFDRELECIRKTIVAVCGCDPGSHPRRRLTVRGTAWLERYGQPSCVEAAIRRRGDHHHALN